MDSAGDAIHDPKHRGNGRLVVNGTGGIGHELARNEGDAPCEQGKAGNKPDDPECATGGLGEEAQHLDERADGDRDHEILRVRGKVLLGDGDLGAREGIDPPGVIVGHDHDGAVALGTVDAGLAIANDVLAVGTRTHLCKHVLSRVRHAKQDDRGNHEEHANDRRGNTANAREQKAHEQEHEDATVRGVSQRRSHEILHLWLDAVSGVHLREILRAVELFLAARGRDANLGIKTLEVILSDAHPFTFRIAAEPLPAVVLESIRLPNNFANLRGKWQTYCPALTSSGPRPGGVGDKCAMTRPYEQHRDHLASLPAHLGQWQLLPTSPSIRAAKVS